MGDFGLCLIACGSSPLLVFRFLQHGPSVGFVLLNEAIGGVAVRSGCRWWSTVAELPTLEGWIAFGRVAPTGVGLVGGCGGNRSAVWVRGGAAALGVLVGFGVLVFFLGLGFV